MVLEEYLLVINAATIKCAKLVVLNDGFIDFVTFMCLILTHLEPRNMENSASVAFLEPEKNCWELRVYVGRYIDEIVNIGCANCNSPVYEIHKGSILGVSSP